MIPACAIVLLLVALYIFVYKEEYMYTSMKITNKSDVYSVELYKDGVMCKSFSVKHMEQVHF